MFKPEVEDVGINIGFGQPHAQQNPGGERPDDIDPAFGIPVMLPGAAPGQRCPHGAYPSVRGMSWAKPLSSISTMGRASRSRAHRHQSFPETPAARPSLLSGASGLVICHTRFAKRLPYGLRCHINRAARSYWQASGWSITSCASFSGLIFRTFRRSRGLGAIRLVQRLIEAMPIENRSAVSPKLRHSFSRTERTCRPKGTGYVIIKGYRICYNNSIT